MFSRQRDTRVNQWLDTSIEYLLVAQTPPTEEHHEQWSELHGLKRRLVQLIIIDWWTLVVIRDQEPIYDIVVKERKCSNREHDWQGDTIHHGHADGQQDGGVFVGHDVLRTSINVDVGLDSLALGGLLLLAADVGAEALIEAAEETQGSEGNSEVDVWVNCVQGHSHNHGRCNDNVPLLSQVGEGSTQGDPR